MLAEIQRFFIINDVIVQFIHGQVFLLLGVASGLQTYRRSRLELARALPWLAAFGVLEAITIWGNVFIPIQERLLGLGFIQTLRFLQQFVQLLCFASLLGFGLRLFEPAVPHWTAPTVALVIVMAFGTLMAANRLITEGVDVIGNATLEALLRYFVCLPSALLVALGLRQQAYRLIGPLQAERLVSVLRVAGFGFLVYALVEGAIVPEAPFWPASFVNSAVIFNTIGVPIAFLRAVVGAVIAFYMFRSLEAFRIEADRLADALRNQQALNTERERISRDLHDGTLQQIYAAGLMIDDAKHALASVAPDTRIDHANAQLGNVMTALNSTTQEIRGYIYDLRRTVAGDEDLARGLFDIVTEFRLRTAIPTDWVVEGCAQFSTSPEQRYHIYQIAREALSNIARHASATRAHVSLSYDGCKDDVASFVCIHIGDNGKGSSGFAHVGKGLLNMRERASLLQAEFDVHSEAGKGTVVMLRVAS
jgi:signal transduction histidine kinase